MPVTAHVHRWLIEDSPAGELLLGRCKGCRRRGGGAGGGAAALDVEESVREAGFYCTRCLSRLAEDGELRYTWSFE